MSVTNAQFRHSRVSPMNIRI